MNYGMVNNIQNLSREEGCVWQAIASFTHENNYNECGYNSEAIKYCIGLRRSVHVVMRKAIENGKWTKPRDQEGKCE